MERLQASAEFPEEGPAMVPQAPSRAHAKLLIHNRGEMAEWLKAAVC